uniref:Uncharacterized protein n=1 Tax=Terrapene triunguis TaxID=2587831 RepID=A0A674JI13_9SAUR
MGSTSWACRELCRVHSTRFWHVSILLRWCQPAPAPTGSGLTWSRVLQNKVFIIKLLPVDGFASGAIVVGEISTRPPALSSRPSVAHRLRHPAQMGQQAVTFHLLGVAAPPHAGNLNTAIRRRD